MNPEVQRALRTVMKGQKFQDVAKAHGFTPDSEEYKALRDMARKRFEAQLQPIKHVPVSMETRKAPESKDDGDVADSEKPGRLVAVFSTFNIMDSDGDVVLPGSVHAEKDVPFTFAHNWLQPSMGKGDVRPELDRAIWDGHLFVDDMQTAKETFASIKNMGQRQEYSWSFFVRDATIEEDDEAPWGFKRLIKDTEMIEVCAAIRGVNRQTHTLLAKSLPDGDSFKAANMFEAAFDAAYEWLSAQDEQDEPDTESDESEKGSRLEDQIRAAQAAVKDLTSRVSSLAETRAKEGRTIGKANLDLLADLKAELEAAATTLGAAIPEPEASPPPNTDDLQAIFLGATKVLAEMYVPSQ